MTQSSRSGDVLVRVGQALINLSAWPGRAAAWLLLPLTLLVLATIIGSLLRSSSHVVTGPTNALSLLVGTAVAATAAVGARGSARAARRPMPLLRQGCRVRKAVHSFKNASSAIMAQGMTPKRELRCENACLR